MSVPLRVLFVDDSDDDVLLLLRELRRGGYDPTYRRVDNAEAMQQDLGEQIWEVVIADHSMPSFSAPAALLILQQAGLDLPFIIVSRWIGEEVAVAAMKAGAHDYITKDNLVRLNPAIERELREAQVRRRHRQAEEAREQAILEERGRLARAMHDGLAQVLFYVNTQAEAARALLCAGQSERAADELKHLAQAVREVYAEVREDILGLRTSVGPERSLVDALREYLLLWQEQSGVRPELTIAPTDLLVRKLSLAQELQLLCIIQEALANVRKNARAQHVRVQLSEVAGWVAAVVEDDGVGFDPAMPARGLFPQFGLAIMRERADSIGGVLEIDSAPGCGTRVVVRLPMASPSADGG